MRFCGFQFHAHSLRHLLHQISLLSPGGKVSECMLKESYEYQSACSVFEFGEHGELAFDPGGTGAIGAVEFIVAGVQKDQIGLQRKEAGHEVGDHVRIDRGGAEIDHLDRPAGVEMAKLCAEERGDCRRHFIRSPRHG